MSRGLKRLIRAIVPRAVLKPVERRFFRVRWTGDYATWAEARAEVKGYDDPAVFEQVKAATRLVRDGQQAYERDGVTFSEPAPNGPLLAGLQHAAATAGGNLSVLDFGGSLGSVYWQHRRWLEAAGDVRWSVVEQPHFVKAGRKEFSTPALQFYRTIEEASAMGQPDVLLLSSVLPYLEDPHVWLSALAKRKFRHVLIDRTGVVAGPNDRLTVQRAPRRLHSASYPCWFLGRERLLAPFAADYTVRAEYETSDGEGCGMPFRGFQLERISS